MNSSHQNRFPANHFTAFYCRLAAVKEAVASGNYRKVMPDMTEEATSGAQQPAGADIAFRVNWHLRDFLEKQIRVVQLENSKAEQAVYIEALYLMAVLADEIFLLEMRWIGRDYWEHHLLEKHFFKSCSSAVTFYKRLDALLNRPVKNSLHENLAVVYLMCLRLGFTGRYRHRSSRQKLTEYGNKLRRFIGGEWEEDELENKLFPQSYQHCFNPPRRQRLLSLAGWKRAWIAAIAGYLLISHIIWILNMPFNN